MGQAGFGHHHAQSCDLVARHEDLAAVALDLVDDAHAVEFLHDLSAVAQLEVAVEKREGWRRESGREEREERDHRRADDSEHDEAHYAKATECLCQAVHCRSPSMKFSGGIARITP